ncbi:7041_t:CDS:10 [Paraglomus brasilianum]|uniref:Glutamate--cysteine ligase n=1 Tax=Paraglomus brasilianum TaxID=144538 RepID=A0A9N9DFA0_9GLOM|nr:7041_t:CDS:10 [Paraglomus brasilianum]
MGLLSLGTPLPWGKSQTYTELIRHHGIEQFLALYNKMKDKKTECLLFGDEVEYMVIFMDHNNKNAKLSLRVSEIYSELAKEEAEAEKDPKKTVQSGWRPEYGSYMLEGTPGTPFGNKIADLTRVESSMKLRRQTVMKYLRANETVVTVTSFPRLGCLGEFLEPHFEPGGPVAKSLFVPDEVINPHPRFPTLTANIRTRRGSKVAINMPIFHDTKTPKPFIDPTIQWNRDKYPEDKEAASGAALPDHIYMDAMCFGMGSCCLQITFQTRTVSDARRLYDQLATLAPIMLALTAAAPIWRGYLSDTDCRWDVIASSVDDRTEEERGLEPLKKNKFVINKSRYDSIDSYISTDARLKQEYNDLPLVYDESIYKRLIDNGIDDLLARHVAHLFIRDPLVIYDELLYQDDETSTDHFENIQSTNWQTVRFKPPPPNSSIGWRVEFRSMEVQITDFENAAFAIFIALLTRIILVYGLNFYIPISKVDQNMGIAHKRGAVLNEEFWFRKSIYDDAVSSCRKTSQISEINRANLSNGSMSDKWEKMTINQIINGDDGHFIGLIPLIKGYLDASGIDHDTRRQLDRYLDLVSKRASGKLATTATWIREFVRSHPKYNYDSVVSQEINYDLFKLIEKLQTGQTKVPTFLDGFEI